MLGLAKLHSNVTDNTMGHKLILHISRDFEYRENKSAARVHGVPINPNDQLLVVTTISGPIVLLALA